MVWIFLLIAVGAAVYFLAFRKKAKSTVSFNGVECSRDTHQVTPKGVNVFSVVGIPGSSLTIIDDSLTSLFADCLLEGYKESVGDYNFFSLYIPVEPCQLSPVDKCPSFLVRGGTNYDQSAWDQDRRVGSQAVLASEMVIDPFTGEYIICPDESVLANAVRYGAEHCLIYANDGDYYGRSQTHTVINHPLIPRAGR